MFWRRYKIGSELLWNVNRKSYAYVPDRFVSVLMTLNGPEKWKHLHNGCLLECTHLFALCTEGTNFAHPLDVQGLNSF